VTCNGVGRRIDEARFPRSPHGRPTPRFRAFRFAPRTCPSVWWQEGPMHCDPKENPP
jgi:hypothetical protein